MLSTYLALIYMTGHLYKYHISLTKLYSSCNIILHLRNPPLHDITIFSHFITRFVDFPSTAMEGKLTGVSPAETCRLNKYDKENVLNSQTTKYGKMSRNNSNSV